MTCEIDQSGKVENTSKTTVIAFSNSVKNYIYVLPKDKRFIQDYYRNTGKPRVFVYQLFSILIFLLLFRNNIKKDILLDTEYLGKDMLIIRYLKLLYKRFNYYLTNLTFGYVGKQSSAHKLAINVYRGTIPKNISNKIDRKELLILVKYLNNK